MILPKSNQPSEENKSYIYLKAATLDSLMLVKFKIFANTAKVLSKFLVAYQTEKPMIPFLVQSVEDIICSFSSMFLLKDTLNEANTSQRLSKLHFRDRAIQKYGQDVDSGKSVKLELAVLKKNVEASDNQIFKFKRDIVSFLLTLCAHLVGKSPIKSHLPRNSRSFIPVYLLNLLIWVAKNYREIQKRHQRSKLSNQLFIEENIWTWRESEGK